MVKCIRADHYRKAGIPCPNDAVMVRVTKISGVITIPLCSSHAKAYRASGANVQEV